MKKIVISMLALGGPLALQPALAQDGESLFKVPFSRMKRSDFPVGRGIMVQAGRAITMQMPYVPEQS